MFDLYLVLERFRIASSRCDGGFERLMRLTQIGLTQYDSAGEAEGVYGKDFDLGRAPSFLPPRWLVTWTAADAPRGIAFGCTSVSLLRQSPCVRRRRR